MSMILPTSSPLAPTDNSALVSMWLHGRTGHTARAYSKDAARFLAFIEGTPLGQVTLQHLQSFVDSLTGAPSSIARTVSAVKSLLSFGHKIGALRYDVGAMVTPPKGKEPLSARILQEEDALRMVLSEPDVRNRCILRVLYSSGMRLSELCGLTWRDVVAHQEGVVVTIFGKGAKTRTVRLSSGTSEDLLALRGNAADTERVFPLSPAQVWRIVRGAASRVGLERVSPHWLRHAHASHALDRGAPIHLVQATLGHSSVATTSKYLHARPSESSGKYLGV